MLDGIAGPPRSCKGVRGAKGGQPRPRCATMIADRLQLVADFPEIAEMDLNPVFATDKRRDRGRRAHRDRRQSARTALPAEARGHRPRHEPDHEAGRGRRDRRLGRDGQDRQLGDEEPDQRRLPGQDLPDQPVRPTRSWASRRTRASRTFPATIDVAVFAIPAKFVAGALVECGEKKIPGARADSRPGFAETGNVEGQKETQADRAQVRRPADGVPTSTASTTRRKNLCATFCTAYDVKGHAALSSQSGGIGMAIIGFSRSAKMGVSAIVGLGNKSDIDEDDLLTFFEQDDNTHIIAQHCEDLKDGRAFAEVAKRVSKKKPVVDAQGRAHEPGRARGVSSHTGALAGNDKIYDDVLRQSGVIRAQSAARAARVRARRFRCCRRPRARTSSSSRAPAAPACCLSDACVDNGLKLMAMPPDLDAAFRKFIPPFGAAGNPVDITGGEPPRPTRTRSARASRIRGSTR